MDYKLSYSVEFDAGVGKSGHHYRVDAATRVRYDPRTGDTTDQDLYEAMDEIVMELRDRSLNDMLPAVPPTAGGLATYFMERLSLNFPRLYKVKVWERSHKLVTVTREIRE